MPGNSQPDQPLHGVVLIVGSPDRRRPAAAAVERLGLFAVGFDDPYAAMAELCRRPGGTAAVLLSLHGLFREELQIIPAVRRAHPHAQVWVTDIDARPAALAEAMRLGVDGLLGEDGLHRVGGAPRTAAGDVTHGSAGTAARTNGSAARAATVAGTASPDADGADEMFPTLGGPAPAVAGRIERVGESGVAGRSPPRTPAGSFGDPPATEQPSASHAGGDDQDDEPFGSSAGEPLLSADELRALLQDQPDPLQASRDKG